MKNLLLILVFAWLVLPALAQKTMTEGIIQYSITVIKKGDVPGVDQAFAGAKQQLLIKGYKARLDFISPLRGQSTIFDAQTSDAFILKQTGSEKYLLELPGKKWQAYNKRFAGIVFTNTQLQKEVAGYLCQQAIGNMQDGTEITVFYSTDLNILARGYDQTFASLSGIPLEYEVASNGVVLNYKAASVQMTLVSSGNFDKPPSGYKVIQFTQ